MNIPDPLTLISRLLILMICFPLHEFAHAWVADRLGDPTPRQQARLTLNPAVHLDIMGSLILLYSGFGWARPVMVNPAALRRNSRAAPMWVALAGPISNLLLAVLSALPFRLGWVPMSAASSSPINILSVVMQEFVFINLLLFFFNLIPLAPLDGDHILDFFLPASLANRLDQVRQYGPMILMFLLFLLPFLGLDILGWTLYPPLLSLYHLLVG